MHDLTKQAYELGKRDAINDIQLLVGGTKLAQFLTFANTGDEKNDFVYSKVGDALDLVTEQLEKMKGDSMKDKPPIGIMPETHFLKITYESRIYDILAAIKRYSKANMPIPVEWVEELERDIARYGNRIETTTEDCIKGEN